MNGREPAERAGPARIRDLFFRHRKEFAAGLLALLATNGLTLAIPWILGRAIDAARVAEAARAQQLAIWLAAVAAAMGLVRMASRILLFNAGRRAEYDLRNELFGHLTRLPPAYFTRASVGDVMSRAVNDLNQVRAVLGMGVLNIANTAIQYTTALVLLFVIDPGLALWSLLPYPMLLVFAWRVSRVLYVANRELQESSGALSSRLQENLAGQAVLRTHGREAAELVAFEALNADLFAKSMRLAVLRGWFWPVFGSAAGIGTLIVLWIGGGKVAAGTLGLGDFVAFTVYLAGLVWPTMGLGWVIGMVQRGKAAMERINEIFAAPAQVDVAGGADTAEAADAPVAPGAPGAADVTGATDVARPPGGFYTAPVRHSVRGEIEIRNLTFAHDGRVVLRDVSLKIGAGQTLAIVGPTASGKSTLVQLVARLAAPPPGTVFLDGVDVNAVPLADLRRAVSMAPQDPFLFSATIAENIAFGRPALERAQVERVAEVAHLAGDVATFPQGYETLVGERGITLSGGQRQRVAIARALAVDPAVLVLDDPLSSVDAETADSILAALRGALRGRTGIVITHRLAAARQADLVAVLDDGRLAELGSHDALVARGGVYARMWREERLAAELDELAEGAA